MLTTLPSAVAAVFTVVSRSFASYMLALSIPVAENAYLWTALASQHSDGISTRKSDLRWALLALFFLLAMLGNIAVHWLRQEGQTYPEDQRWKDFSSGSNPDIDPDVERADFPQELSPQHVTEVPFASAQDDRDEDAPQPTFFGWMTKWR